MCERQTGGLSLPSEGLSLLGQIAQVKPMDGRGNTVIRAKATEKFGEEDLEATSYLCFPHARITVSSASIRAPTCSVTTVSIFS